MKLAVTSVTIAPTVLLVAVSAARILCAGELLPVVNPTFENVLVACEHRYAYQALPGGSCADYVPQQDFNSTPGIGWQFSMPATNTGAGLTGPGTEFDPPPFAGLPFSHAAFLQNANSEISQTIFGFVANQPYRLAFYLGSRYDSGGGDQTVVAFLDGHVIGEWSLVSYTPFTIQNVLLKVFASGPHTLKFIGTSSADHTAFISGITIEAVE